MPYKNKDNQRKCAKLHYKLHREEYLARTKRRNKEFVIEGRRIVQEAKNKPCTDCGICFHFSAMDFDHIDSRTKSFQVSRLKHCSSLKRLYEELAKCELVCANCHRVRTYKRKKLLGSVVE